MIASYVCLYINDVGSRRCTEQCHISCKAHDQHIMKGLEQCQTQMVLQADRGEDRGGRNYEEGLRVTVKNSGARKPRAAIARVLEVSYRHNLENCLDRTAASALGEVLPAAAAAFFPSGSLHYFNQMLSPRSTLHLKTICFWSIPVWRHEPLLTPGTPSAWLAN